MELTESDTEFRYFRSNQDNDIKWDVTFRILTDVDVPKFQECISIN